MKSEIFSIKTFFKNEIENLKAVFSSSNNEESSSIKSVNDRLVQHLLKENKTKNDIIMILAENFSVNVNKPQSTDFSLQRPQKDIVKSETSIVSEESRHKSISSIPKEPIKLNKGVTESNHRTSQYQSSSLNSQNKSLNPSSNNNQNQHASSPESGPLSNTSSKQSSLKNSKIESKKDVIIIGDSMLNGINEGLSDDRFKVKVKNHSGATTEDICDFIKPEACKKPDIITVHAGTNDTTNNTRSFENYKKDNGYHQIKVTKLQIRTFQRCHEKRQTR